MRIVGLLILLLPLTFPVITTYATDFVLTGDYSNDENEPPKNGYDIKNVDGVVLIEIRKFHVDLNEILNSKEINLVNEKTDKETTPVYVKIFKTTDAVDLMEHEIDILGKIHNKGKEIIPKIYKHGITTDKSPFIIMELFEVLFIDLIQKGFNPPVKERLNMYIKLVELFEKLHDAGIVYCYVHPQNIGIHSTDPWAFKLLNVNVSTSSERCEGGTKLYAAPEIIKKDNITGDGVFKSDIYSLGIMLFAIESEENKNIIENKNKDIENGNNSVHFDMIQLVKEKANYLYKNTHILSGFEDFEKSISIALQIAMLDMLSSDINERPTARELGIRIRRLDKVYDQIEALNKSGKKSNFKDAIKFVFHLPYETNDADIKSADKLITDFVKNSNGDNGASGDNPKIRLI